MQFSDKSHQKVMVEGGTGGRVIEIEMYMYLYLM